MVFVPVLSTGIQTIVIQKLTCLSNYNYYNYIYILLFAIPYFG